jgi:hypothetical protein
MRSCLFVAVVSLLPMTARSAWAGDTKDADVEKAFSKIAQLGPGVHAIKKDAKGRITSCVVVGQSRISTALGKAKALETARQRARNGCAGEFIRWLKEKATVVQSQNDETITLLEGSEESGKEDALKESGKAVEKTSTTFRSISNGLVRGLQVLHFDVSDKDKTYTLVMGWSADNAKATQDVTSGDKKPSEGETKKAEGSGKASAKKPIDKKIEDKKVTSEDAKKFLPD